MLNLAANAETQAEGFSLVPWIPLLVAFVVGASTLGTAWWNSRGETAALRQLKAMNEALTGLPTSGDVRSKLEAARDRLALRIADSDVRRSTFWRRIGVPGLAIAIGMALTAVGLWGTFNSSYGSVEVDDAVRTLLLGAAVGIAAASAAGIATAIHRLTRRSGGQ
ncbi:hypothetical protein IFU40_13605 [Microbacterium sp. CFBP 13617]|uniref:hypothetical protein n=1 Tax=Microbacterium sp. CFBP 13617 TaxID=2774035 RepID=UPI00178089A2|nr:hypothetical protein [Microbacterium sp. CFBP 13617]MBD8219669.1 hypothetical protein [Microbacterium sp. CFBP 13617]